MLIGCEGVSRREGPREPGGSRQGKQEAPRFAQTQTPAGARVRLPFGSAEPKNLRAGEG